MSTDLPSVDSMQYLLRLPASRRHFLAQSSTGFGLAALAGILRHGPALCAAFAPTVNSYKRLVRRGLMAYYS